MGDDGRTQGSASALLPAGFRSPPTGAGVCQSAAVKVLSCATAFADEGQGRMEPGMRFRESVLTVCVALTAARYRSVREEQWRADLRDGPEMGIPVSALLVGALRSSLTSRIHEVLLRCSRLLSRLTKGENMKLALGALGTAVALAGLIVVGTQGSGAGVANDGTLARSPIEDRIVAGYEGWWSSTPLDGSPIGPDETVAINTASGKIVDYFNRARSAAGEQTTAADSTFSVTPDPTWPANSVVIIDTATGKVIEDFPVDEKGWPILRDENGSSSAQ